jgi:hypothetical protein
MGRIRRRARGQDGLPARPTQSRIRAPPLPPSARTTKDPDRCASKSRAALTRASRGPRGARPRQHARVGAGVDRASGDRRPGGARPPRACVHRRQRSRSAAADRRPRPPRRDRVPPGPGPAPFGDCWNCAASQHSSATSIRSPTDRHDGRGRRQTNAMRAPCTSRKTVRAGLISAILARGESTRYGVR